MKHWWVNHAQTARQEIGGGYIWSPKREANGARSRFYDNMRLAAPGDPILSYASGAVGHVGMVADYAIHAPKPDEFGPIGSYWGQHGWLVPVQWRRLSTPVQPRRIIDQLRGLLPPTHSPIRSETGTGNQKAYLAEIDQAVHQLFLSQPGVFVGTLAGEAVSLAELREKLDDAADAAITNDRALGDTEKLQLMKARRGQGEFRKCVAQIESGCRITKIANDRLLIASHIKPWRSCETADERLDGNNGLLLAPHVDWLFDRGLLGFQDDGRVLISKLLTEPDIVGLGLRDVVGMEAGPFSPAQCHYLQHHRDSVFLS